jgi:hypothetical protein
MRDSPPPTYRRTLTGFEPANDAAKAFWRDTKPGQAIVLEGRRPRNLARHNWYWAMLTIAAENMPRFETPERLHVAVKQALRLGEFIPIRGGQEMVFVPASTSFAKMKEAEFVQFLEQTDALLSESLGVPVGTLMREAKEQEAA